jgi:cytochrome c
MSLEFNKIAASVLVAGIIALVGSIVATHIFDTNKHDANITIATNAPAAGTEGGDAPKGAESIMALLASADIKAGQDVFKKCVSCHTAEKDGPHRVGPNLWNVVGEKVGTKPGYAYSKAMASHGGNWDYQTLSDYLFKPNAYVKGTKMTFVGISKTQERANIIAYLRTMGDNPQPLPDASATAQPVATPASVPATPAAQG